jgi:RNA polymerase sigma factor (sigma-70 family)
MSTSSNQIPGFEATSRASLSRHLFLHFFIEAIGWDRMPSSCREFRFSNESIAKPVAQKRGIVVLTCEVHRTDLANRSLLRRHQRELRKLYHEHILIHYCESPRKQVWQWVTSTGNGRRIIHREHPFFSDSAPPRLLERLEQLAIPMEQEEQTTLVDVLDRVRSALLPDAEFNLFARRPWYAKESDRLAMALKSGVAGAYGKFVEFHMPLARKASRMLIRWFGMDADDAEQTAMIGLLEAARRFEPDRGFQFSTYASYWLKQCCQRYGLEWGLPIRMPTYVFWPCYRLSFLRNELIATYGPSEGENRFAEELELAGVSVEQWENYCHAQHVDSFSDMPRRERPVIVDDHEVAGSEELALAAEFEHAIQEAIATLKPRQQLILKLRYGFGDSAHTLQQIADQLGITRERVRQIQSKAEEKLASRLKACGFEQFTSRKRADESVIQTVEAP